MKDVFLDNVRRLCKERDIKIEDLGKLAKLVAWHPEKNSWSLHHLHRLSIFFDVPMEELQPLPDGAGFSCNMPDWA